MIVRLEKLNNFRISTVKEFRLFQTGVYNNYQWIKEYSSNLGMFKNSMGDKRSEVFLEVLNSDLKPLLFTAAPKSFFKDIYSKERSDCLIV